MDQINWEYELQSNNQPIGLQVDILSLFESAITQLPHHLTVYKYLDLAKTRITHLPDDLTVVGNLYLDQTNIAHLPDDLKVGGKIYE